VVEQRHVSPNMWDVNLAQHSLSLPPPVQPSPTPHVVSAHVFRSVLFRQLCCERSCVPGSYVVSAHVFQSVLSRQLVPGTSPRAHRCSNKTVQYLWLGMPASGAPAHASYFRKVLLLQKYLAGPPGRLSLQVFSLQVLPPSTMHM